MKHIYFSVINDLECEKRVHRIITTLQKPGTRCTLVGRKLNSSRDLPPRGYEMIRFRMLFKRGFLFYAFFNIRLLFFFLTRKRIDVLVANDLDTLPANFIASRLRKTALVYDSHEYFTETPELTGRIHVKNFWLRIERIMLPHIRNAYTVSREIADEYNCRYGTGFGVIRNLPERHLHSGTIPAKLPFLKDDNKVLLYQGSLNIGRGLEAVINAVRQIEKVKFLIIGDGDLEKYLKKYVIDENLSEKIYFTGRIPFEELASYTIQADGGISMEEDMGLNYRYALPNKLFDYIAANVPVLVSDLPGMAGIVKQYDIGIVCGSREPDMIIKDVMELLFNETSRSAWKRNLKVAADELSWEKEKSKVMEMYSSIK